MLMQVSRLYSVKTGTNGGKLRGQDFIFVFHFTVEDELEKDKASCAETGVGSVWARSDVSQQEA